MAKFNVKAITIYCVAQKAQGSRVTKGVLECAGTVTTVAGSAAVVGVGTAFLTDATVNAYLYDGSGYTIGQIKTITDNTNIVLYDVVPAVQVEDSATTKKYANDRTGSTYQVGLGARNAVAVLNLNYSDELTTESAVYVGDELSRDEDTWVKDRICKVDFETFLPALGTVARTTAVSGGADTIILEKGTTTRLKGSGTTWLADLTQGSIIWNASNEYIGTVKKVWTNTILELAHPAKATLIGDTTAIAYKYDTVVAATTEEEAPFADLYEAVSLGIDLGYGYATYSNSISTNTYLEVEYRLSSPDLAGTFEEKTYRTGDVRGTVDFDLASIGTRAKLKVMLQGNLIALAETPRLIADYGMQKTQDGLAETVNTNDISSNINWAVMQPHFAEVLVTFPASIATTETVIIAGLTFTASATVTKAELLQIWSGIPVGTTATAANTLKTTQLSGKGTFSAGTLTGWNTFFWEDETTYALFQASNIDTSKTSLLITGTAALATPDPTVFLSSETPPQRPYTNNICFDKITAPNVSGFQFDRYMLSCEAGWSKTPVPTDVTVTIVEDLARAAYNPHNFLSQNHRFAVNWGHGEIGRMVDLDFTAVRLANISKSTVANFIGQDLQLRQVGKFTLTFR